ncbi:MAG: outer membrane protein assembly factor BamA, partial [Gemmataceae bacterium]|nr:outer membrane protein assembly factor BamA [Gemmataceae bacterium]
CSSDLAVVVALAASRPAAAGDGPGGRVVSDVVPVGARLHPPEQILNLMHTRAGKPYSEATIQDDVRRLHATKWFVPGSVEVRTAIEADGRVQVFVHVAELSGTVQEVHYVGAEHVSPSDLATLCGVRKGDPMNPLTNELGRQAILRKYQEMGRYFASVELVEGNKPGDTRVVYSVVEGPVVKVTGTQFKGNQFADAGRLRTALATKKRVAGVFGGKFNPMSLDVDRQRLVEYYQGLGFLAVQVTPEVVRGDNPGHVSVVYHIEEGGRYKVGERQIDGNQAIPTPTLEKLTEQKVGGWYDRRLVQGDLHRMQDAYGYKGYPVGVDEKIYEVPDRPGVVRVHYQVQGDRGEPDRVGRVIIEGNNVTKDRVIYNQLDLRPGQILQYPRLEDARVRLSRLGIFDPQNPPTVEVLNNELDDHMKDILVRVQETRTGQFMVGGGVNSNAGLSGSIVINESNFDLFRFPTSWDDFRLGRAWRGAGQQFRLEAVPGTIFQRYSMTFTEPRLFDTLFSLTDSVYYFNRAYAEYYENRVGTRVTVGRQLDPIWRAGLTTRVEGVEVKNVPYWATPAITDYLGWHYLVGLRGGVTRDSRDSFIFPTKGSVFDVGVEEVLGSYTYPIGTAEFTKFLSSSRPGFLSREDGSGKHVFALRSQLSVAGSNTPVYDRFYAGGFRSLRGFSYRGVGPVENQLFTGGTFAFLNSVEYQVPLMANDKLFFVTFLDHGTVERNVEIKNYRVAAGFGFRIAVPALGPLPIALDFAFPLNRAPWDNRQMFSFYVGLFGGPGQGGY